MKDDAEPRDAPEVSAEQVAAFRLSRHHLAIPAPKSSLARVAGDMGGAQAQIMSAGALSLRARVRGLRPEDVEKALWQDRTLAKIWCMRGTVHLVPSDDLAVFARGSTGRANRDTAWLEGHGPATVKDFFAWARMTLTAARAIWARLVGELAPVRVEGEAAWLLRKDLTALRRADAKRPNVRLLPYFDSFLMGHDARGHLIDSKHYKRVYLPAGWIAPVVLVDGRVAGVWSYARKGGTLRIEAAAFHPLPTSVREA